MFKVNLPFLYVREVLPKRQTEERRRIELQKGINEFILIAQTKTRIYKHILICRKMYIIGTYFRCDFFPFFTELTITRRQH